MNNPIVVPMTVATDGVQFDADLSADNVAIPTLLSSEITMPPVTGVKGSAESEYRTGNVSISAEDIDLTGYVIDPSYVHTDENFTSSLKTKLEGIHDINVTISGDSYAVTYFVKGEWNGIPGVGLCYDDGSPDGGMVFLVDDDTMVSFEAYLDNKFATFADIPTATSQLQNDSGYITASDIPVTSVNGQTGAVSLSIPSATSDIVNDSGYITGADVPSNETDPTVPSWAKQPSKPTYTASEVGALPDSTVIPTTTSQLTNNSGFITGSDVPSNETDPTVPSWAKAPTKPTYTAAEVGALPDTTVIPTVPTTVSSFTNDVPYAVANNDGYAMRSMSIPFGQVDVTSTSTVYTATVPGITELKSGVCVYLRNGVVTSASGFTVNINNLGAKPCYNNLTNATRDTTIFNVAYNFLFVYDEALDGGNGGWWIYRGYDANTNTIAYQVRTNSMSLPMESVTYRYRLFFTDMSGEHFVPSTNSTSTNATAARAVNQAPIDPFGRIVYYGTTASVAAGSRPNAAYLWRQYAITLGYSFNRQGSALNLTLWKPVWLKCSPQTDGSAIIDATTPYVQDLPTTEDGYIYIYLGVAYSATQIELTLEHPVKWYKDGAIRNWFG